MILTLIAILITRLQLKHYITELAKSLFSEKCGDCSWDKPTLVAWGVSDKYLPQSIAEEFQNSNPSAVKLKLIEGAGHMPQEDWYVALCSNILHLILELHL